MKVVKKCDICKNNVYVDQWGNGKCKKCGWYQNADCLNFPKVANPPNFISLNKAKRRYKKGENFYPTFKEFINLVERGFDFSFAFKNKKYQILVHDDITLWEVDTENYVVYKSISDFKNNLSIDNQPISTNWQDIKKLEYNC